MSTEQPTPAPSSHEPELDFTPEELLEAEVYQLQGASYDEMLERFPDSELLIRCIIELRRKLAIPAHERGGIPVSRGGRFQDLFGKWPGEIDDGFEEWVTAMRRRDRELP